MIVNGRGFVVVSNGTRFYGDFLIENNSSVSTSAAMLFYGRFEVQSGSKYESNADYTQFNADADQDIIMDGDVSFAGIYCSSTKADSTTKTFKGSINSTQYIRAMGTSRIVDDASTYHHTFVGATAEGRIALSSPMTIRGGTLRKSEAKDPVVYGTFSLGTGDITIQSGDVYVRSVSQALVQVGVQVARLVAVFARAGAFGFVVAELVEHSAAKARLMVGVGDVLDGYRL